MATHLKSQTTGSDRQPAHRGVWSLMGSAAVIAYIWIVLLPGVAEWPSVKSHIRWLDQKGIDPSAMYYTELEVMETILQRQRAAARGNSQMRK